MLAFHVEFNLFDDGFGRDIAVGEGKEYFSF